MSRNKPEWDLEGAGPWDWTNADKLTSWWKYGAERAKDVETIFTMGMRGDGDRALTGASPALLEEIVGVQQGLLHDVFNTTDLASAGIGQMWCMYKEVQGYFADGMEIPDDGELWK